MGAEQKATELGISFPTKEKGYLNLCVRSGNLLITSGHVSDVKGKLGASLPVERATRRPGSAPSRSSSRSARPTERLMAYRW